MTVDSSLPLLVRIAALSVVAVFLQIGVISEVPVFGVSVDISPLLVCFVGLLCGSVLGAIGGFAIGLLVDLLLLQTLGVTSLIFTVLGYWSGRLRELRDPQAALTPLLVGAAGSAVPPRSASRHRRAFGAPVACTSWNNESASSPWASRTWRAHAGSTRPSVGAVKKSRRRSSSRPAV